MTVLAGPVAYGLLAAITARAHSRSPPHWRSPPASRYPPGLNRIRSQAVTALRRKTELTIPGSLRKLLVARGSREACRATLVRQAAMSSTGRNGWTDASAEPGRAGPRALRANR